MAQCASDINFSVLFHWKMCCPSSSIVESMINAPEGDPALQEHSCGDMCEALQLSDWSCLHIHEASFWSTSRL